jgi:hypothetical protein
MKKHYYIISIIIICIQNYYLLCQNLNWVEKIPLLINKYTKIYCLQIISE